MRRLQRFEQVGYALELPIRRRQLGTAQHHDRKTPLTRDVEFCLGRVAAAVFTHHHVEGLQGEQRAFAFKREWAARRDDARTRRVLVRI